MILGIAGKKFHGKDTFAKMICSVNGNYKILHFADKLKNTTSKVFNIDINDINDTTKKEVLFDTPIIIDQYIELLSEELQLKVLPRDKVAHSIRELLQYVGTDYVRSIDEYYWANTLNSQLDKCTNVVIPDVRFGSEVDVIRKRGGSIIYINRFEYPQSNDAHASENSITSKDCDWTIHVEENNFELLLQCANVYAEVATCQYVQNASNTPKS